VQKDKDVLEKVQRRTTRMIGDFRTLTLRRKMRADKMTKWDKRRRRGDLLETYKVITKEVIPFSRFFQLTYKSEVDYEDTGTKVFRKSEGAIKQRFFSSKVVEDWNELGDETVSVGTIRDFKPK